MVNITNATIANITENLSEHIIVNTTESVPFSFQSTLNSTAEYIFSMPDAVIRGDIPAIILALLSFFIFVVVVNKLSQLLLAVMKRTILLIIVTLVILDFTPKYINMIQTEGTNFGTILVGIGALIASGAALFVASRALFRSWQSRHDDLKFKKEQYGTTELGKAEEKTGATTSNVKEIFSKDSLVSDRSLMTILVYLIVAEFGVFSSPTLSAPTIRTGIMFFGIFAIGIIAFVYKAYQNHKTGFLYLGTTFVVGVLFSFILGWVWANIPITDLVSINFFKSDSLIALITGMSVSLFAGSKG